MLLIYTDGGPDHRLTYVSIFSLPWIWISLCSPYSSLSYEEKLKGSIRLLRERHPDLSEKVLDSVEPMLKDHNFSHFKHVQMLIWKICGGKFNGTQPEKFVEERHFKQGCFAGLYTGTLHYIFIFTTCQTQYPLLLIMSLYGKDHDTTEEHCPSKKLAEKKGRGMPFSTQEMLML